jgi:hypothetical protein
MRRLLLCFSLVTAIGIFIAPPSALAQQSVNFYLGGFVPHGEDARLRTSGGSSDVLVNNLDYLIFRINDFNGATVAGDWRVQLGDLVDAGLGLGFYRRTVPTIYLNYVNRDGSEIDQQLRLRIVPFTATVRLLPFGHNAPFQPYIGAGVGVFAWRYSETGQFVDFSDLSVFRGSFTASGSATGPVVLGGVGVPIGRSTVGFEIRYQSAEGKLPSDQGFSGSKIDLGGWNYVATFGVRF